MHRLLFGLAAAITSVAGAGEPLVKVADYHLLTPRTSCAAVADQNYLYVVGGANTGGLVGDIERFDPRPGQTSQLTEKLMPRIAHGAALIGGRIYIIGGWTNALPTARPESTVEIHDLAAHRTTHGAEMLSPRGNAATVALGGKIYVIGGTCEKGTQLRQCNYMEIYDPLSDKWAKSVPMPKPSDTSAAAVGGLIVVPGGDRTQAALSEVEFFVPQEDRWKGLPDLCQPMSHSSVAFLGDSLYLFGNLGAESDVVAYHLPTRTSRTIKPGYLPARNTAAVVLGDRLYVVGGNRSFNGPILDDIQVFALANIPAQTTAEGVR